MGAETAEEVAKALKVPLPIHPRQIIRYTLGKPLDFTSGHSLRLFQLWLLRAGPGHRGGFREIPTTSSCRRRFWPRWVSATCGRGRTSSRTAPPRSPQLRQPPSHGPGHFRPEDRPADAAALRGRVYRDDGCQWRLDRLGRRPAPLCRGPGRPPQMPGPQGEKPAVHARAAAWSGGPRPVGQAQGSLLRLRLGRAAGCGNRASSPSGTGDCWPEVPRCWSAATTASTGRSSSTATPAPTARSLRA